MTRLWQMDVSAGGIAPATTSSQILKLSLLAAVPATRCPSAAAAGLGQRRVPAAIPPSLPPSRQPPWLRAAQDGGGRAEMAAGSVAPRPLLPEAFGAKIPVRGRGPARRRPLIGWRGRGGKGGGAGPGLRGLRGRRSPWTWRRRRRRAAGRQRRRLSSCGMRWPRSARSCSWPSWRSEWRRAGAAAAGGQG